MNTKHTTVQIRNMIALTIILAVLPSLSSANVITSLSSVKPERLGEGFVSTIALSPDGTIIAAAHRPKTASKFAHTTTVLLWDAQTREQIGKLAVGNIRSIAFSPDGTLLALAGWEGDNRVHLWDMVAQDQVAVLPSSVRYGLYTVAFSPDGKTLAYFGGSGEGIRLWDVQTRTQIGTLLGHTGNVRAVAFSPNGRLLASGGNRNDEAVRLWDVEGQVQVRALTGHSDMTMDLAFSPDGSLLASAGGAYDKAVYLWDMETQEQIGVLGGHPAHVGSAAFSPDGKLLATSSLWEPTIFLWDVQAQTQLGQLTEHDVSSGLGWGHEVVFAPDGKWLACSSGNGVEIWDLATPSIADFNGDGAVEIDDLLTLIESWGQNDPLADIGPMPWGDGIVDAQDALVLVEYMAAQAEPIDDNLASGAVALSAAGGNGGKQKIDPVLYWVSFPADPLNIYFGDTEITGQIDRPEDPDLLVGRTYPDEKAHVQPKNLRLDDDFAFEPGADGGDDFDIAFTETTYTGAMAVNDTATWVQIGLKALNRDGKRQSYVLHANVDPPPETWDPLAMNPGDTVTLSLGAWELRPGDTGAAAKSVHAWGNFDGATQIRIVKQ